VIFFFTPELKKILSGLYKEYDIEHIDRVMTNIISDMGGNVKGGEYARYIKNFPVPVQKQIYKKYGTIGTNNIIRRR